MTAVTPAAGGSWKARCRIAELPSAGCAVQPACSSCRPPSRVRQCGADRQRGHHQRFPMGFVQRPTGQGGRLVKVAVRGERRLDRGDDLRPGPASPQRSPEEPLRAWAVADRAVGRRVVPCEGPLRDAGDPPPVQPSSTRPGRSVRSGCLPKPPTTGNTGLLESQVEREVDATPARQSAPVALGS